MCVCVCVCVCFEIAWHAHNHENLRKETANLDLTTDCQRRAGGGGGVSVKGEVMGFCPKLATSKKGGGVYPFCTQLKFPKRAAGGYRGCAQVCICPVFGHAEGNFGVSCFKSDGFLHSYLMLLFHISGVAGTRWPKGLAYNNGGLHSTSSPMQWWL